MKPCSYANVRLTGGYLFDKQEFNRTVTLDAVYNRFSETGRVAAFDFAYREGDEVRPHIFWDSDVAKWMEGAAYVLRHHPDPALEAKVDALVDKIAEHQQPDGYFNIYFTVVEPEARFTNRDKHELYCAGHLMEAAVAYAEATGKTKFLDCMEKYAALIRRVFMVEKSAAFATPGHEEIELALLRLYRYTGHREHLELAAYFINTRGTRDDVDRAAYNQSHLPVREQNEAVGHAVRALYLYTGMASLAAETHDASLIDACRRLYDDITRKKMYVTGATGSTYIGEAFTRAFDLPNDLAYAETCASIALVFFTRQLLALENRAAYADTLERALYNGVLAGLSLSGDAFFYENPLEINLNEHFESTFGHRRLPITERVACFSCSCCPPNLNRLLASLGGYLFAREDDTLFVNLYAAAELQEDGVRCTVDTAYPADGEVRVSATGVSKLALRIPGWCKNFTLNRPYTLQNGYAVVENDGGDVLLSLAMPVRAVFADRRVLRDAGKLCIQRGPVVYCAESVDNGPDLRAFLLPLRPQATPVPDDFTGLPALNVACKRLVDPTDRLYFDEPPAAEPATLRLIPYSAFANRGESDMLVWFNAER